MVKNNPTSKILSPKGVVLIGLACFLLANYLGQWGYTIFGYWPPSEIADRLHWLLGNLTFIFGITLIFARKQMTWHRLGRIGLAFLAVFAFLFGWLLTSAASQPMNVQNDGFNVTGGFLMFFSGIYVGYLARKVTNGKK